MLCFEWDMCITVNRSHVRCAVSVCDDGVCLKPNTGKNSDATGHYLLYASEARREAPVSVVAVRDGQSTEPKLSGLDTDFLRKRQF